MATARIYERTGASAVLATGDLSNAVLDGDRQPYLKAAGTHIATVLGLDEAAGMKAALALAPGVKQDYVASVVGPEQAELCGDLLRHIESSMDETRRHRLHKEIAAAVAGTQ